jgi:hypothetical protein
MAGYTGGRRPVGKPRGRLKDAVLGDTVSLLQTRNWEAALRKTGVRGSGKSENGPQRRRRKRLY